MGVCGKVLLHNKSETVKQWTFAGKCEWVNTYIEELKKIYVLREQRGL